MSALNLLKDKHVFITYAPESRAVDGDWEDEAVLIGASKGWVAFQAADGEMFAVAERFIAAVESFDPADDDDDEDMDELEQLEDADAIGVRGEPPMVAAAAADAVTPVMLSPSAPPTTPGGQPAELDYSGWLGLD